MREAVELWLAWRHVQREVDDGLLGAEFDRGDRAEVMTEVKTAEAAAKDQVWSGYRFVILSDAKAANGLKVIDLGAGHASANETLSGHIITALKSEALLNESIGADYIDRHWPPAFVTSGSWPLGSLRQSFLNGTLTRLLDPERVLRTRIIEFVAAGEFGLGSGAEPALGFRKVWFHEDIDPVEIAFESDVYLLTKAVATKLKLPEIAPTPGPEPTPPAKPVPPEEPEEPAGPPTADQLTLVSVTGNIPTEQWNRLGTRLIPKLRAAGTLTAVIRFEAEVNPLRATALATELQQIINELGLSTSVRIESKAG
jgi:hypothetical protein